MDTLEHLPPLEVKFADATAPGAFEGYGAVWGNVDSHGDVIKPGTFSRTLSEHKAAGTMPRLYIEHGAANQGLAAGVYTEMTEDSHGLLTKGRLSGVDSYPGSYYRQLIQDGALKGQSIGFRVHPGGFVMGKSAGEPRRTLTSVHLAEVSFVGDPSNDKAGVLSMKAAFKPDTEAASNSVAAAMRAHHATMTGDSYSSDSSKRKAVIMNHLRDAHSALTGDRAPADLPDWKSAAEVKTALIAAGISPEQAEIAALALEIKSSTGSPAAELTSFLRDLTK